MTFKHVDNAVDSIFCDVCERFVDIGEWDEYNECCSYCANEMHTQEALLEGDQEYYSDYHEPFYFNL